MVGPGFPTAGVIRHRSVYFSIPANQGSFVKQMWKLNFENPEIMAAQKSDMGINP